MPWNGNGCGKYKGMRKSRQQSAIKIVFKNNWRMWNISVIWVA
jgi:hypothetical protein